MRICEVIGKVTLSRSHAAVHGATWRIAVPLSPPKSGDATPARGEPFVVFDPLAAGEGSVIAVSEGAEASAAFYPDQKPIDAYNAAILDRYEC